MSSKKVKATTTQTETETLVYIGPTIPGVASRNSFYTDGITTALKDAIAKEPAFGNLVVPISQLADAQKELQAKSGATYVFYQKASNYTA